MKKLYNLIHVLFIMSVLFAVPRFIHASTPNNKFGIHLAVPSIEDLKAAKELVNSNGGDWGYVTLVIQENDRDVRKWQDVFENLREMHLIPLIRLATKPEGAQWRRPQKEDIAEWVKFLDSLHWVVKDRYIVLFNEPNHGSEWGGTVDMNGYRETSLAFAKALKEKHNDFFVMLAGFDASAPSASPYLENEEVFLQHIFTKETVDAWNKYLSGWSSHSYPNPGFSGSPYGVGKGSVRTYQWEREILNNLGVKQLPVFITETGWDGYRVGRQSVAYNIQASFESVWLADDMVQAVTPFILNYQAEPFANFSWTVLGGQAFYPQYYTIQGLVKQAGDPIIINKGQLQYSLPKDLVAYSNYRFRFNLNNQGQAIWDKDNRYRLVLEGIENKLYIFSDIVKLKPFQQQELDLFFKTDERTGVGETKIVLYKDSAKIVEGSSWNYEVVPLPSLKFKAVLYPKLKTEGDDFELQIFNEKEEIIFKKDGVNVRGGVGWVDNVQNITLGSPYRVVLKKLYYLPRQAFVTFQRGENNVKIKQMYPFDFNSDGKLDWKDFTTLIRHPKLLRLLIP